MLLKEKINNKIAITIEVQHCQIILTNQKTRLTQLHPGYHKVPQSIPSLHVNVCSHGLNLPDTSKNRDIG